MLVYRTYVEFSVEAYKESGEDNTSIFQVILCLIWRNLYLTKALWSPLAEYKCNQINFCSSTPIMVLLNHIWDL